MRKDPTEFRKRFLRWKLGDTVYEAGLPKLGDGTVDWDRWDNAATTSYSIPFIKDKAVMLTNAGNATGAVLSTNLLDSIADNAARAGLPLETALGLAVKESTLGNPTDTRSAWNLSSGIRRLFNGIYPGTSQHINRGLSLNERDVINYHKGYSFDQLPYIELKDANKNKSILQEAFEFYGQHPDRYNSRQKNYQQLVNKAGKAVMQSPEVQAWLNSRLTKTTKDSLFVLNLKNNKGFLWKLPKFADGTEGRSYGYLTEDKHPIKFDEQGNLVDLITGDVGTMRLPEVQVSTANPKNYRSSYDPDAIRNFTDWLPLAGDAGIGIDIADAIKKDDYIQAGALGGMALLPNIIKKPLKYISKPIKRFITNGSVLKRIIDASRTLNFTKDWDNDTYARWMLNGQKTPEFKYVWHGRGTDRGKPEFALRTYSDKDVGLHLTENKPTAERFAKKNGVVYLGVDYGTYPDAIYADINTWRAKDWLDLIRQGDELTPKIEKEAAMHFSLNVVDKSHGKIKSIRDLAKQFSLKRDEIASFAKKYDNAGLDWVDREDANRLFSEYLKQHGVNFKYMNEFEGGGYEKPSIFISDPSNIRWIPEIRLKPTDGQKIEMMHYLDWKNRKISRFKEPYTFIQ